MFACTYDLALCHSVKLKPGGSTQSACASQPAAVALHCCSGSQRCVTLFRTKPSRHSPETTE